MGVAAAELAERRLAEKDDAGLPQLGDDEGVVARHVVLEQHRAERRRHAFDVALVLHDDRDAVQRTDEAGCLECGIEPVGFFQRGWIERNDRIDRRALLIVGGDAVEIGLHQRTGRERPGLIGSMDVGDRRFEEFEGLEIHSVTPSEMTSPARVVRAAVDDDYAPQSKAAILRSAQARSRMVPGADAY